MTALFIIGLIALIGGIALTFIPVAPSMVFALAGVWAMDRSGYIHVGADQLMFWLVVTGILLLISHAGRQNPDDGVIRRYMAIGSAAGTAVAVALGATVTTVALGPVAGCVLGVLFYCRIRRKAFTLKGLFSLSPVIWPMVVTYTLAGITLVLR